MWHKGSHVSDLKLQMFEDHELNDTETARIQNHIAACLGCRMRHDQLRKTIVRFDAAHRTRFHQIGESKNASRAALRARMAAAGLRPTAAAWKYPVFAGCVGLSFLLVVAFVFLQVRDDTARLLPNPKITPGAIRDVTKWQVCVPRASSTTPPVSAAMGQTIFAEYGIGDPRPGGYELDHLIDPELGGSEDARNLWPQPYSAVWNARVKDALEQHLHDLVCSDQISLSTAQQDVAHDWIAAYRKYFHTDKPIIAHLAFTKDMPWNN
jgi:hypothetical protein